MAQFAPERFSSAFKPSLLWIKVWKICMISLFFSCMQSVSQCVLHHTHACNHVFIWSLWSAAPPRSQSPWHWDITLRAAHWLCSGWWAARKVRCRLASAPAHTNLADLLSSLLVFQMRKSLRLFDLGLSLSAFAWLYVISLIPHWPRCKAVDFYHSIFMHICVTLTIFD